MWGLRFVQYVYLGGVIERICTMSDSVEETDPSSENRSVMFWMSDLYKVCFRVSMVVGCIPIAIFPVIGN